MTNAELRREGGKAAWAAKSCLAKGGGIVWDASTSTLGVLGSQGLLMLGGVTSFAALLFDASVIAPVSVTLAAGGSEVELLSQGAHTSGAALDGLFLGGALSALLESAAAVAHVAGLDSTESSSDGYDYYPMTRAAYARTGSLISRARNGTCGAALLSERQIIEELFHRSRGSVTNPTSSVAVGTNKANTSTEAITSAAGISPFSANSRHVN